MRDKQTLYIMCGLGFAGKSTLAKKIAEHTGAIIVSQDENYFEKQDEIDNSDMDSKQQWNFLLNYSRQKIDDYMAIGKSVVFDNTSCGLGERDALRAIAGKYAAKSIVVYLDIPYELADERYRKNKITKKRLDVKQEYLDDVKRHMEIPTSDENLVVYTPQTNLNDFWKVLESKLNV